ncbi:MAG: hypothetical protein QW057_03290 [Candidatus Bathyarchaeia archaeon]
MSLLQRTDLTKGAYGFTHRNIFRAYSLADRGKEVAKKQAMEKA